jgi:hypothetical protein
MMRSPPFSSSSLRSFSPDQRTSKSVSTRNSCYPLSFLLICKNSLYFSSPMIAMTKRRLGWLSKISIALPTVCPMASRFLFPPLLLRKSYLCSSHVTTSFHFPDQTAPLEPAAGESFSRKMTSGTPTLSPSLVESSALLYRWR